MHRDTRQERHDRLARKTARLLNSISVPGVGPMTCREKLLVLLVLLVVAASVVGLAALAGHPR